MASKEGRIDFLLSTFGNTVATQVAGNKSTTNREDCVAEDGIRGIIDSNNVLH